MGSFIGFAEVAGAIIGAMGLAMCLEWLALNGLMNLMPRRDGAVSAPAPRRKAVTVSAGKASLTGIPALTLFPR